MNEHAHQKPEWLTTEQLAAELETPLNTLLHWRKCAKGPPYHKFGRRVRYKRADVESWAESCRVGPAAPSSAA